MISKVKMFVGLASGPAKIISSIRRVLPPGLPGVHLVMRVVDLVSPVPGYVGVQTVS